jgi:hypothetical protein
MTESRSPARFLAPIALAGAVLAVVVIIATSGGGSGSTATAPVTPAHATPRHSGGHRHAGAHGAVTHATVRSGDTPGDIARRAGISVQRLLKLNPGLEPQALHPGQKLIVKR